MKLIVILSLILSYSLLPTLILKEKWKKGFENKENKIMLTFDDGPDRRYTMELLDLLLKNDIRASFFLVTDFARENPEILKRMEKEGHCIGIHSTDHTSSLIKTPRGTRENFIKSIKTLEDFSIEVKYYRPPWGQLNLYTLYLLKKYNKKLILWNVMADDWKESETSRLIVEKLSSRIRSGSIICLHDGRGEKGAVKRTIGALEEIIPELKSKGYKFITVGEYYGK